MGITRHLPVGVLRGIDGHPRLQGVLRRLTEDLHFERSQAVAVLRALYIHALEDLGDRYFGVMTRRLRRVEQIRSRITQAIGRVIEEGTEPEFGRAGLDRLFDELQREMDALESPQRFSMSHGPDTNLERLFGNLDPAQEALRATLPPVELRHGQHGPLPAGALRDALDDMERLHPVRRALFERVRSAQGFELGRAIFAESEHVREDALARTLSGMSPPLGDAEVADLRQAIDDMTKARWRAGVGVEDLGARRAFRLADAPEPLRRMAVGDNTILGQLAVSNPEELLRLWRAHERSGGTPDTFRAHVRREMQSYARPYIAEFDAAFDVAQRHDLTILKDPAAFDPSLPNQRRVNPREGGSDIVGIRRDGEIWYIDDKSHRLPRSAGPEAELGVSRVSAFEEHLAANMIDDASELRASLVRNTPPGHPPDPLLVEAAGRLAACGEQLRALTAGWEPPHFAIPENQARIRAVLDAHRVKLKLTSTRGDVTHVTDRLRGLGIEVLGGT